MEVEGAGAGAGVWDLVDEEVDLFDLLDEVRKIFEMMLERLFATGESDI